jgi:hypothetical protein
MWLNVKKVARWLRVNQQFESHMMILNLKKFHSLAHLCSTYDLRTWVTWNVTWAHLDPFWVLYKIVAVLSSTKVSQVTSQVSSSDLKWPKWPKRLCSFPDDSAFYAANDSIVLEAYCSGFP